jgi:hypothetical protein
MKVHYFGTAFSLTVGDERAQGQEEQKMKMMISAAKLDVVKSGTSL